MKKETIAKFILTSIGLIGGVLVSEQVISGETLASIQGYAGMALGGGAISIGMIIGAINLIPKSTAQNLVDKVGSAKIEKGFNTIDTVLDEVTQAKQVMQDLYNEIMLDRQVKSELGVFDNLSQETKDKLGV